MNEQPPAIPDAQGTAWNQDHHQRLVQALAEGTGVNDIAAALGRTRNAITSRMELMVPSERSPWPGGPVPATGSGRRTWLVQQLQKGDYPWAEVLAYKTGKSSQVPVSLSADADAQAEDAEDGAEGAEERDAQARELRSADQAPQVAVRSTLKHAGETWTEAQCTQLVSELRAGLLWPDIAANLERGASAIRTQAARMVPADAVAEGSKARRADWLREQLLTDANYDWRTPLRANTDGALWLEDDDAQLRAGWHAGTALAQLARQFDCSEAQVVRRLVVLRLAAGTVDVVDRLGCTPGGAVETRYLLATDAASAHLHVLIGSEQADGAAVHVSVHTSTTAAAERAAKVDQMRARAGQTPLHWSSGERRVDLAHGEGELHPLGEQPA